MPFFSGNTRRALALHSYALVCAMAGLSGLGLSLWACPAGISGPRPVMASASMDAGAPDDFYAAASAPALIVPAEANGDVFRGIRVERAGSL